MPAVFVMIILIVGLFVVCLSTIGALENERIVEYNLFVSFISRKKINVLLIDLALYSPIRARLVIRKRRKKRGHIHHVKHLLARSIKWA
jgi:hypothetical protein